MDGGGSGQAGVRGDGRGGDAHTYTHTYTLAHADLENCAAAERRRVPQASSLVFGHITKFSALVEAEERSQGPRFKPRSPCFFPSHLPPPGNLPSPIEAVRSPMGGPPASTFLGSEQREKASRLIGTALFSVLSPSLWLPHGKQCSRAERCEGRGCCRGQGWWAVEGSILGRVPDLKRHAWP